MRVFDDAKKTELTEYDLTKGYLREDKLFIAHHETVEGKAEQGHYETVKEYPNGGKEIEWVIDSPEVKAQEAYDEYEPIYVYVPFNDKELAEKEIAELKAKLASTDYKAIKYAEGILTDAEYAETKAERQNWRNRINELEKV